MKLTNSSGKAIKKYDETLYDKVLWNSQEPVIDNGDKLVMKLGMGKFCSFKDFDGEMVQEIDLKIDPMSLVSRFRKVGWTVPCWR